MLMSGVDSSPHRHRVSMAMRAAVAIVAVGLAAACGGCDKGPAQKAGEKVDNAVDKLTGKGPAEKAGERIDKAVDSLKK